MTIKASPPKCPDYPCGPPSLLLNGLGGGGGGILSPGVKLPGHESDLSSPVPKLGMDGAIPLLLLYTFIAYSVNLTFCSYTYWLVFTHCNCLCIERTSQKKSYLKLCLKTMSLTSTFVLLHHELSLFSDAMNLYFHYFMKFTYLCSVLSVFCITIKLLNSVQYTTAFIYLYSMNYFVHPVPKNINNICEKTSR
jgi:hypothetical protein